MIVRLVLIPLLPLILTGCWLAAAGAGAEAGYVMAQEDRTAGEVIDDQRITASVKTKLLADPDVSGLSINVDSMRGVVTLKGAVNNENEKQRAIDLAKSVEGVKSVNPRLAVV